METKSISKTDCRKRVHELIEYSAERMRNNLERVFLSGAVELSSYEDNYILPKTILLALLKEELTQQTIPAYRKQMEKDAKNIYAMI